MPGAATPVARSSPAERHRPQPAGRCALGAHLPGADRAGRAGPCLPATLQAVSDPLAARIADALRAACHPQRLGRLAAPSTIAGGVLVMSGPMPLPAPALRVPALSRGEATDVDALVVRLFEQEGRSLVRLVRLFVDDRNAAEDLVQEGFIRLA